MYQTYTKPFGKMLCIYVTIATLVVFGKAEKTQNTVVLKFQTNNFKN